MANDEVKTTTPETVDVTIREPIPSPEDLLYPGIEPRSPALWADSLPSETPGKPEVNVTLTFIELLL